MKSAWHYGLMALSVSGLMTGCATRKAPVAVAAVEATSSSRPVEDASWKYESLAQKDPLEFLRTCRQHYLEFAKSYRCVFHMRERDAGGEQQVIAIKFREQPYSVDMTWLEHPAGAKRISYVEGRWVKEGRQLALVVPSGVGGLILPAGLKLDIHGKEFKKSSSRSVDQFGFRKTLERAIRLCEEAAGKPDFRLTYAGRGEYAGRPQYMLERRLPYSEGEGTFPDRLAVFYLDAEWLTPIAVWSYGDEAKEDLLGEFITTDVEFNVELTDSDFE